jgi:hypothetical protein
MPNIIKNTDLESFIYHPLQQETELSGVNKIGPTNYCQTLALSYFRCQALSLIFQLGQQDEFAARLEHAKNTTYLMLCKSLPNRRTFDNESVVYLQFIDSGSSNMNTAQLADSIEATRPNFRSASDAMCVRQLRRCEWWR